jgi:hypothetical protein
MGRPAERALGADRAAAAADAHRPRIAVVGQRVEVPARRQPEHRDQRVLGQPGDLADGRDPPLAKPPGGDRPDAPQPLDRERVEECQLAVRRHDEQAVRLGDGARHLGEVLGPGHPHGDGQADPLANLTPQPGRDLGRRAREPPHPAHVEERLVDREALDERRGLVEQLEHRLARVGVGRHAGLDHDRARAEPAGLGAAHRRADAVGLRLVARREHDAPADDDRAAAKPRFVPLLDGRIERVQVGVQDRYLSGHEHMFARRSDESARRDRGPVSPRRAPAGPRRPPAPDSRPGGR